GWKKLDISAFSIQSATAIIIKEAETCIYVPASMIYQIKRYIYDFSSDSLLLARLCNSTPNKPMIITNAITPAMPKNLVIYPTTIPTAKKSVSENVVEAAPRSPINGMNS